MNKPLTDTQRALLRAAAAHPHGLAAPPPHLPPAPRIAVAKALLGAGLLARAVGLEGYRPGVTWKLDGEAVLLRITEAGLQAIGAAPAPAAPEPQPGSLAEPPMQASEAAQEGAEAAAAPHDAAAGAQATAATEPAQGASVAVPRPTRRDNLPGAARAVLAAWDGNDGVRLAAALDALRAALPERRASRPPGASRPPRQGTKQAAVLALLRWSEGASGPAIVEATGWAPHTVRGFLAGLKKRGVQVLVHDRVRQVGPGKDGAKGSFTVYRVAEAG